MLQSVVIAVVLAQVNLIFGFEWLNTLYERVIRKTSKWGTPDNLMYVVGATRVESLLGVRTLIPENFLLIPGVGAQGANLAAVCRYGMNKQCGLLVNASRSIIYADSSKNFASAAAKQAEGMQQEMAEQLMKF